jgi:hypothetical protein
MCSCEELIQSAWFDHQGSTGEAQSKLGSRPDSTILDVMTPVMGVIHPRRAAVI